MKKIQHPKDIFAEITRDYKEAYGNDLVSIILYGSGAGTDYQPGTSNLNFLIILSEDAIDHLDKALGTVTRWKKRNVAVPLVMTDSYIRSSLDSYPLEFLNMKSRYECVYGKDVLKDLSFPKDDLRLQCEREIKGKLLLLREEFLMTEGKTDLIKDLIARSITAFISIFRGLLYLRDLESPETAHSVVERTANAFSFHEHPFLQCLKIKENSGSFSPSETEAVFKTYLHEVRKLWHIADTLE